MIDKTKGSLVISLDYELMWGMIDVAKKNGYGQTNVKHVPKVIDLMLALFQKYSVHATFATVGMIMYKDKDSLLDDIPSVQPTYINKEVSPYENDYMQDISKSEECLFFEPEVVQKIKSTEGIEVGTHTFCHYYCWEKGQTVDQFEVDIQKAVDIAKRNGIELKSIVFPRNNVSEEHLKVCAKYGIICYRGNAMKYYDEPMNAPKQRICRLLDTYLPIGGNTCIPYSKIRKFNGMINLQASRLLRPYSSKLSFLEGMRLKRIKNEMLHAAKNAEIYHIWWHPHNFGANIEQNHAFLEALLKYYKELHEKYGMQSFTMEELSSELRK